MIRRILCAGRVGGSRRIATSESADFALRAMDTADASSDQARPFALREHVSHDTAFHVRESVIPSGMTICQPFMVEAHQVQNRGVKVVNVNRLLDCSQAVFVSRPMHNARLHASTCKPRSKRPRMVLSALGVR